MIFANRKYVDPTPVLRSLTDDFGNPILIGEQRDIGEFLLNFIERIEEGLGELKKPSESQNQEINELGGFEQFANQADNKDGIIDSDSINAGLELQFSSMSVNQEESKSRKMTELVR